MQPFGWYRRLIRNPKYRGVVILASLLYFISPFDLSPEFFPLLGQVDDVVVMTLLLSELFRQLLGAASTDDAVVSESSNTSVAADADIKTVDVKAVPIDPREG